MSVIHAEHIGSFVRPKTLLDAIRAHRAGTLDAPALAKVVDDSIRDIVSFQELIGLPTITDGEFRRRSWSAGFIDAIDGFGLRDGKLGFRSEGKVIGVAASPYAKSPLKRKGRIVADDFRFLKSLVKKGIPKATIASPAVMHFFLGPQAFEPSVYKDRESFFAALTQIYRDEIADLASEGCTYLQIDDTALPCNCDPQVRADVTERGENADELTERYVKLINEFDRRQARLDANGAASVPRQSERAPGWPRAATMPLPTRCSTASTWISIASNMIHRAPVILRRCALRPRARPSFSASSQARLRNWN